MSIVGGISEIKYGDIVFSGGELEPNVEEALIKHWLTQVPEGHSIVVSRLASLSWK